MLAERLLMGLMLGGIAIGCVLVLYPFFSAILWAGILVFTTWPAFLWVSRRTRLNRTLAAAAMVTIAAVLVVLPLVLAAPTGADDVARLRLAVEQALRGDWSLPPDWIAAVPLVGGLLARLWESWAADLSLMGDAVRPYMGVIAEGGFGLLLGIVGGVLHFALALFIAFFFYVYGEAVAGRLYALLFRIAGPQADRLINVTGKIIRGTVYGILGTAIVQGFLTAFGLYVAGVPRAALLGTLAGFLSVLPIGAPLVWIPSALWLMGTGHTAWGILLAIYGVVAVSGADSVIRPWFIAHGAKLPFLLGVLGVLGGALGFGLLGIFLGPVLLGVGFTLANEWAAPRAQR